MKETGRLGFPDFIYELYDMEISYSLKTLFRFETYYGVFI